MYSSMIDCAAAQRDFRKTAVELFDLTVFALTAPGGRPDNECGVSAAEGLVEDIGQVQTGSCRRNSRGDVSAAWRKHQSLVVVIAVAELGLCDAAVGKLCGVFARGSQSVEPGVFERWVSANSHPANPAQCTTVAVAGNQVVTGHDDRCAPLRGHLSKTRLMTSACS